MTPSPNFRFDISVTEKPYKAKPTATDYKQMRWCKKTMSLRMFISMVKTGYSYCHIYYNNLRRKGKFLYTQVISIDVDDAPTDLSTFYFNCHLKPTFAYETFSNGINGKNSYRLVYVFKERINSRAFVQFYEKICRMTGLSNTKDHCGKVITQLMNGTHHNARVFHSDLIYSSITDLPVEETEKEQVEMFKDSLIPMDLGIPDIKKNTYEPKPSPAPFHPRNNINKSTSSSKQYSSNDPDWKTHLDSISEAISLAKESVPVFLKRYGQTLRLLRWSKLNYNEAGYCVIPEDHLSLFVRYSNRKGECRINPFHDGEKRRNRLFIDGCIIRKIKPEITFLELFFNLVHRVYYYYDNSDGVLSEELIARKAYDVMTYDDFDSMTFKSMEAGKVTTSPGYCRNNGISRRAYSRKALMYENYSSIQKWYNPDESVTTNLKVAKERGLKVSLSTLRRYCRFNNIPTNPGHKDFSEWYDPVLSVKQNILAARA